MSEIKLPEGWDDGKIRRVLAHYEGQSEDEAAAEDEAGVPSSETAMAAAHDLVPKVRELMAKRNR